MRAPSRYRIRQLRAGIKTPGMSNQQGFLDGKSFYDGMGHAPDKREQAPAMVQVPMRERRQHRGQEVKLPSFPAFCKNRSESPVSNRIFFPSSSQCSGTTGPGSPPKYRSVRVVFSTRTVRKNCGITTHHLTRTELVLLPVAESSLNLRLNLMREFSSSGMSKHQCLNDLCAYV